MDNSAKLTKLAVVGSCVSRDIFNSKIMNSSEYRNWIKPNPLTIYQTATPSLVRETPIEVPNDLKIKPAHEQYLLREYSGKSIQDLVDYSPELILMDFFADIHFGVTGGNNDLTRNTMAIKNHDYYTGGKFDILDTGYMDLVLRSMDKFCGKIPNSRLVVNSARYAYQYISKQGEVRTYDRNIDKLKRKNELWGKLDEKVADEFSMRRIDIPSKYFIGDENNFWGLHPVHYSHEYYAFLWEAVKKLMESEEK